MATKSDEQKQRFHIRDEIRDLYWVDKLKNYPQELKLFIQEHLTCSVCLLLLDTPYEFNCKHRYCKACVMQLNSSSRQNDYLRCPVCKAIQSRNFQIFNGQSMNIKIPIICFICASRKYDLNYEESKTESYDQVWNGSLEKLEDHILYCHDQFKVPQEMQQTFPCPGEKYGCPKNFKTRAAQIMHEAVLCPHQWKRCLKCFQVHFGKYFRTHECRGGNLSEITNVQIDFKDPIISIHKLLIIFSSEGDGDIQFFIVDLLDSLQKQFMFTVDEQVDDHQGSNKKQKKHQRQLNYANKQITFNNSFLAQNFISALNNKQIHPTVLIKVFEIDELSFQEEPQVQLEKKELFDPTFVQIENDDKTVFIYGFSRNAILRAVIEQFGPIVNKKIFGKSKRTNTLCGIIQFHTEQQAKRLIHQRRVRYQGDSMNAVIYVRR